MAELGREGGGGEIGGGAGYLWGLTSTETYFVSTLLQVRNVENNFWVSPCVITVNHLYIYIYFLLALLPPSGVVFYSPLVGFNLLACEVS